MDNEFTPDQQAALNAYFAAREAKRKQTIMKQFYREVDIVTPGLPQDEREAEARKLLSVEMTRRVKIGNANRAARKTLRSTETSA